MSNRRYKYWVLRSPSGDLYRTYSLSDFVKAHPEEFPNAKVAVHGLYIGSAASGWIVVYRQTMDGEMIASPPKKNRNFWTLRSPSGEVYGVSNLRQFLRDHPEDFPNIDTAASAFTQVTGTARTVRGWSVLPDSETSAKVSTWSPVPFCRDCGRELTGHIRVTRCPECQKEANRRNNVEYRQRKRDGKVREIGSTDICEACGGKYTVESGSQRYCKACATAVVRENCSKKSREQKMAVLNERSRAVPLPHTCTVCGKEFYPSASRYTVPRAVARRARSNTRSSMICRGRKSTGSTTKSATPSAPRSKKNSATQRPASVGRIAPRSR